ncbi:hypothetical protein PHMEG_00036851, partial [Phytophthora megakarya]
MPLVDDLLTDMEAYLWFCSLDAASGFWARMMDNALWGFVQPKGGWKGYSERMQLAEEDVERIKTGPRSKFEAGENPHLTQTRSQN